MEENHPIGVEVPPLLRKMWILWIALLISIVIYAVVGYLVKPHFQPNQDPSSVHLFTAVIAFVAAVVTVLIFVLGRIWASKPGTPFQSFCILRWALAESIAIYGLVLYFIGASWVVFYAFWFWSLCLFLILMPNKSAFERFQRLQGNGHG